MSTIIGNDSSQENPSQKAARMAAKMLESAIKKEEAGDIKGAETWLTKAAAKESLAVAGGAEIVL